MKTGLNWVQSEEEKGQTEHRTAQSPTLATFRSWGSSAGAGRAGLPGGKDTIRGELFAKWLI